MSSQRGDSDTHRYPPAQVGLPRQCKDDGAVDCEPEQDPDVDADVRDGHEPAAPLLWCHLGNVDRAGAPGAARAEALKSSAKQQHEE
eukprot:scaffold26988_cov197-Isochrysis_galbana.AAC.3